MGNCLQRNLSTYVLNVEDMLFDKEVIRTKEEFNLAYENYDKVLKAAVKQDVTIISLHLSVNNWKSVVNLSMIAVSPNEYKVRASPVHNYLR